MTSYTVGLSWNRSTDAYTRLENLAGLTLAQSTAYLNGVSPWGYIGRLQLRDDGSVSSRCLTGQTSLQAANNWGDNCYDDSVSGVAANGQAMWYLPAFYYYTNHTPGTDNLYRWYISPTGASTDTVGGSAVTWKLHPAFTRNSVTKPWIALGTYEGYNNSSKLESKAGVLPTCSQTIATFRTQAQARGTGWQQQDYLSLTAVQLLYLIEYGNFNSQSTTLGIGPGITIPSETHRVTGVRTGWTGVANGGTDLGNASGRSTAFTTTTADGLVAPDTGTAGQQSVSYRGLENMWGNIWHFIDGINIKADNAPWIADNGFVSDTFTSPYVNTSLTVAGTNSAVIADITVSATYDYGFTPSATGASATTKLCDGLSIATGNAILATGYSWVGSALAGLFYFNVSKASSQNANTYGSRLMYIPP